MKFNIDYEGKTITLLDEWNLDDFYYKMKEIAGNEEANWDKWTITQEVKIQTVDRPTYYPTTSNPLSQPYRPLYDINKVTCGLENKHTPMMQEVSFKVQSIDEEQLKTNTYSHT